MIDRSLNKTSGSRRSNCCDNRFVVYIINMYLGRCDPPKTESMVSGVLKVGNSASIKFSFGLDLGWLMLLFRAAITRETYSVCYVV